VEIAAPDILNMSLGDGKNLMGWVGFIDIRVPLLGLKAVLHLNQYDSSKQLSDL